MSNGSAVVMWVIMNKFVFLSFVVMGWAFYELSGGADFQPPQRPEAVAASQPAKTAPAPRTELAVRTETPTLTRRNPAPSEPAPAPKPAQAEPDTPEQERITIRFGPEALPPADPNNPGLLVSLEQSKTQFATPLATFDPDSIPEDDPLPEPAAAVPQPETPAPDMREISGTRVNMRDGPGTIYPVIARLRLGQEVEVLSDSGTGWLRIRTMPGRQLGWVAASLTGPLN